MAIFGKCIQVHACSRGGDIWNVRSEFEETSSVDSVFFRCDVVSGLVGWVYGLGVVGLE